MESDENAFQFKLCILLGCTGVFAGDLSSELLLDPDELDEEDPEDDEPDPELESTN